MKNNLLVLCLVAGIAILLGVGISVKATNDPLLASIVNQQQQILGMQQKMENQLTPLVAGAAGIKFRTA